MPPHDHDPILCFVDAPWAYFTSRPLAMEHGSGWRKAPYEHNAGPPFIPRGVGCHRIVKVAYGGRLVPPCEGYLNSPFSVHGINTGAIAWLRTPDNDPPVAIFAGTPLSEFIRLVRQAEGAVYLEVT